MLLLNKNQFRLFRGVSTFVSNLKLCAEHIKNYVYNGVGFKTRVVQKWHKIFSFVIFIWKNFVPFSKGLLISVNIFRSTNFCGLKFSPTLTMPDQQLSKLGFESIYEVFSVEANLP